MQNSKRIVAAAVVVLTSLVIVSAVVADEVVKININTATAEQLTETLEHEADDIKHEIRSGLPRRLLLAMEHTGIQMGTSDFNCEFFANFPDWFKLDEWLPVVFNPTGYCSDIQWQFLGFTMPQWMLVVYAGYLLMLVIALIGEFARPHPSARW